MQQDVGALGCHGRGLGLVGLRDREADQRRGPAGGDTLLDNRGATMGLLPNGCSRMITPYSTGAAAAQGMADWSDWQHFTTPGFADIDTISDVVRSTSAAYSLFPNLTVTENIAFGLRVRGLSSATRTSRVAS